MFSFEDALDITRNRCETFWGFLWEIPRISHQFREAMDEIEKSIVDEANWLFLANEKYVNCVKYNLAKEVTNSKMDIAAHILLGFPFLTESQSELIMCTAFLAKEGMTLSDADTYNKILRTLANDRYKFLAESLETNDIGIVEIEKIMENEYPRSVSSIKYEIEINIVIFRCQMMGEEIVKIFKTNSSSD